MSAKDMTTSSNSQEVTGALRSELDAVRPYSTTEEPMSCLLSEEEQIQLLFLLLKALAHNVLSRDQWMLSMYNMIDTAKAKGFSEEHIVQFANDTLEKVFSEQKKNPMSTMF